MISTEPSGVRTAMNPEPASEAKKGSETHAAIAEARQASTALPPPRATATAASAPSWLPAAIPSFRPSVMAEGYSAPLDSAR